MNNDLPTILKKILDEKQLEVSVKQKLHPLEKLIAQCETISAPRDFVGAVYKKFSDRKAAVIAEIKQGSPSKGIIRPSFDPVAIAQEYEQAGAACLSILTDEKFFFGSAEHLIAVRQITTLPILRKDFVIDPYQVYETRAMGADCILLIVAALNDEQLLSLYQLATALKLAVLVESHTEEELQRALQLSTPLIGINNRDLHTFNTSLDTTFQLAKQIPNDRIIISESGINTREDIAQLQLHNIHAYLIGESLMRHTHPGVQLQQLL